MHNCCYFLCISTYRGLRDRLYDLHWNPCLTTSVYATPRLLYIGSVTSQLCGVCVCVCVCKNWKGYVVKHRCVTWGVFNGYNRQLQGAAFNVTHFEIRITHLLNTAINTTEHGQVSQCLGFTKSLASSIQRLVDVLHDNQGIAAISQVHLPWRDVQCPA